MTSLDEFWADVLSGASGASGAFSYCTADFARKCNTNMHGDNIRHNGFFAPLAPLAPLSPLASPDCPDDYAMAERLAIQAENDVPPDRGWDDVAGFADMPELTPAQHGAIRRRITNLPTQAPAPAISTTDITTPAPMPPAPAIAPQTAPAIATCGACAEFEPGPQPLCIGRCSRTLDGLPPIASRGYGACYPMAPRTCPDYKES